MRARINRSLWRNLNLWVILLTGLYLVILATRVSPYFFGPDSWQWHGRPPSPSTYARWWPSVVLLSVYLVVALVWLDGRWADRPSRRREWAALTFLILMAPAIQIALKYIHYRYPVEFYLSRTIGPHNGFWQIAIGTDDLGHYLRTFPQQMQSHPFVHTSTHPPGDFVYVWLWRQGFEHLPALAHSVAQSLRTYHCANLWFVALEDAQIASALSQMLIPLLSGLPVVPLYLLGKRLAGPRAGLRAAVLYVVLPALTLFTMRWDQLYPLFLCCALYWLHIGLVDDRPSRFFLAGFSVSVASFMSFGNVTILALLGVYGLAHLAFTGASRWRAWLRQTWQGWGMLALGCVSVWLVYQVRYGVSFAEVFSAATRTHLHIGRSYWVWAGYNLYDFATFVGIPVAVFLVSEGVWAWRRVLSRAVPREALPALAVSAALLAVNFSGVVRGEVGRLWLLWMPAACLVVAVGLAHRASARSYKLALALLALQALCFTLFLRVSATGMPSYQPRALVTTSPSVEHPLHARLGESVALVGYDLEPDPVHPGDSLYLTLYWQALEQPDRPYTVFTHLVDAAGVLRGQQDNMPLQNSLPTTCWRPGEFIADPYAIVAPPDAAPGEYTIRAGMYDLTTGERLPVTGPAEHPPDQVILGPVQIVPP